MNSTILSSSVDFGFILTSAFEYVDMGALVLFLLSFLTLMSFGLLFLYLVTIVLIDGVVAKQNASVHKVG